MEAYLQKQLHAQRRHIPQAVPRTEAMAYSACAAEATPAAAAGPSLQRVRHNAAKCWEGYERVPGTKEYAEDSCRKKGSGGKKKKKSKSKDQPAKKGDGGDASSASSSSDDEDGKPKAKKAKKAAD